MTMLHMSASAQFSYSSLVMAYYIHTNIKAAMRMLNLAAATTNASSVLQSCSQLSS